MMSTTNLHSPVAVNTPAKALSFIFPKSQDPKDPMLAYFYTETYVDNVASSKCPKCKILRTTRTVAEGEFVQVKILAG